MDSRVRLVRGARAQPGIADVLRRAAPENRAPFSALQFRIRRLALRKKKNADRICLTKCELLVFF